MTDSPDILPDDYVRQPPSSIEAETCVIGALVISAADAMPATKIVSVADFYRPAHQIIYQIILDMIDRGEPIDLVTLKESLIKAGKLRAVGGIEYVVQIVEGVPSSYNAEYYAGMVREKAVLRALILECQGAEQAAWLPTADLTEILGTIQGGLYELDYRLHGSRVEGEGLLVEGVRADLLRLGAIKAGQADPDPPMPTGFTDLDRHMDGGLRAGELLVLAAGPEQGKSTLALCIAANVCAIKSGSAGRALFISGEMPRGDISRRVVAARTGVSYRHMRVGDVTDDDLDLIGRCCRGMKRWRFAVVDRGLTVQQIGVEARRWALKWGGLDLIVIDYLQRMRFGAGRDRQVQVSDFSCGVKQLAMSLHVPVLLLAQINREGKKADRPPELFDLRDSGAVEDDADYVLMMHECGAEKPMSPVSQQRSYGRTQVSFRKGRNAGHTAWGAIWLIWRPWIFRFEDDELVRKDETP